MVFVTRNWEILLGCLDAVAIGAQYAAYRQYREINDFLNEYRIRIVVTDLVILSVLRFCVLVVLGSVPISFRRARRAALDICCIVFLCCSEAYTITKISLFRHFEIREKVTLVFSALTFNTIEVVAVVAVNIYISKNLSYYLDKDDSDYMELGGDFRIESEDEDGRKKGRGVSFRRLLGRAKPETGLIVLGSLGLVISALTNLAIPFYFGKVIAAVSDTNASAHSRKVELNTAIVAMVLVFVIGSVASVARSWMYTLAGQRVVARLRRDLFLSIIRQEISFFDSTRTGELTNRLSSDTSVVQNAVTNSLPLFCRYIFQIAGSLVILMIISWKLTLVMLSVVPPVCIGTAYYARTVQRLRKAFQDALADASANAEETISGIRTIRVFNAEEFSIARYVKDIANSLKIGARLASLGGLFIGIVQLAAFGAIVFVLWYGGELVIKGEMNAGKLTSFLLYTLTVSSNVAFLLGILSEVMQAVGASTRVFEIMDRKPALRLEATGGDLHPRNPMKGHIKIENIHFSYPSREGEEVIKGLSLDIPTGKVTAVVGQSGGGKSTLVSLLERLYDPSQGRITIDGYDLMKLTSRWHRSQVGLVSQEPILFNFSISENIRLGKPTASQAQVEEVAKLANAHSFISSMDDGYDTIVGERGVKLSGGQKQRVAIARALLLEPRVLLLDEATSAQDAESEHLVKEAISRAMEGRTVLIVAHRLSTIRDAAQNFQDLGVLNESTKAMEQVAVMRNGVFAQVGTHDELIKDQDGIYHQLVQKQLHSKSPSEEALDEGT